MSNSDVATIVPPVTIGYKTVAGRYAAPINCHIYAKPLTTAEQIITKYIFGGIGLCSFVFFLQKGNRIAKNKNRVTLFNTTRKFYKMKIEETTIELYEILCWHYKINTKARKFVK